MSVVLNETFTGTNGDPWPNFTLVIANSGVADIQSNTGRLEASGANYTGISATSTVASSVTDVRVSSWLNWPTDNEQFTSVRVRCSGSISGTSHANSYYIEFYPANGLLRCFKRVSGSSSQIITEISGINYGANLTREFVFEVEGENIRFRWWNASSGSDPGTWLFTTTNGDVTAAGALALHQVNGGATTARPCYWDNVLVEDMAAGGVVIPVFMHQYRQRRTA